MLQNDCFNEIPSQPPEKGRVLRATQSVDTRVMSCGCGSFSFHLVRVAEDMPLDVMCAGCLSVIHKGA